MHYIDLRTELSADVIGAKASGLAQIASLALPTPRGFVYSTNTTPLVKDTTEPFIRQLADITDRLWNKSSSPLTVSVRSGAPVSMPGMMDTILNVGLTRKLIDPLADYLSSDKAFGLDCYRRLIQMFGVSVEHIDKAAFAEYYDAARIFYQEHLSSHERACNILVEKFEKVFERETGTSFPQNPTLQLKKSIRAVFDSWNSPVAVSYREANNIPHSPGTAVIVQEMVYGNCNDSSGAGVIFSHDPNTGKKGAFGEFITRAQGEDVVAGTHQTTDISVLFEDKRFGAAPRELKKALSKLYAHHRDMVDVEFTIENKKLYILQCRPAKRSRKASIRFTMDKVRDGEISSEEATLQIIDLLPTVESLRVEGGLLLLGKGIPVCGSIVTAPIAINKEGAATYMAQGEQFIFVTKETSPSDHIEMSASLGILTSTGGTLSHAAVIARSWDKTCVVGCEDLQVHENYIIIDQQKFVDGDILQINGETGDIYRPAD